MTPAELEAHGLHQCPTCLSTYETETALVFCCDTRWDTSSYERNWERD